MNHAPPTSSTPGSQTPPERPTAPPPATLRGHLGLKQGLIAFVVLLVLGAFFHPHAPLALGTVFGFYAWFGFLSCAALVVLAKLVFGTVLKRSEDYYGE